MTLSRTICLSLWTILLSAGCGDDLAPKKQFVDAFDDTAAATDSGPYDTAEEASDDPPDTDDPPLTEDDADGDGINEVDGDCDDNDDTIFPGAQESCDGRDDDCDGSVDSPDPINGLIWYEDVDGDGWGIADVSVISCLRPVGFAAFPGDCDDANAVVNPGQDEVCDELDNDCDGRVDGEFSVDAVVNYEDDDEDGYGNPDEIEYACLPLPGMSDNGDDCNDDDPAVHPEASETCDGVDQDCNGIIDDGFDMAVYYPDEDGDGHGDIFSPIWSCAVPISFVSLAGDCDDANALIHTDMPEFCDDIDNNCDGFIDEDVEMRWFYEDVDGDGYGAGEASFEGCSPPVGFSAFDGDCDDDDPDLRPGRLEECNGIDDNCDTVVDEGHPFYDFYLDSDADGYGAGLSTTACLAPPDHVLDGSDCDDTDATVNPGIYADCEDGRDEDCDGEIDEGPDSTFYRDVDGDGYGDVDDTLVDCAPPEGYVWDPTDCDDTDATVNPGVREDCGDGLDTDCDGWADDLDPDCDCPEHTIEEDEDIEDRTGDSVASGTSTGMGDDIGGSCGSSGGEDYIVLFRAEEDGCYTFDTESSDYDTVLRLYDACEGTEIACDDDSGMVGWTSKITQGLLGGDEVLVVVDGYSSFSSGSFVLDIEYAETETTTTTTGGVDDDLDSDTGSVASGTTVGMGSDFDGSCGLSGAEDVAYTWEAPSSGCYSFSTAGSDFDTVLRLFDDSVAGETVYTTTVSCGGGATGSATSEGELTCNDDHTGLTSFFEYTVTDGETYVVVVDGFSSSVSGSFSLAIEEC